MARAETSARSSSDSVTVPTWCSGSSYALRANTSQTVSSERLISGLQSGASLQRNSQGNRPQPVSHSYDDPQPAHRLPRVGADPILGPDGIPHDLQLDRVDVRIGEQRLADVVLDELGRRAAHR